MLPSEPERVSQMLPVSFARRIFFSRCPQFQVSVALSSIMASVEEKHNIVILGAGVSGLACARQLQEAGVGCLVLEASERIGGRVHTVEDASGLHLDLGATWIHGLKHENQVFKLACEEGLAKVGKEDEYSDDLVVTMESGGRRVPLHAWAYVSSVVEHLLKETRSVAEHTDLERPLDRRAVDYMQRRWREVLPELVRRVEHRGAGGAADASVEVGNARFAALDAADEAMRGLGDDPAAACPASDRSIQEIAEDVFHWYLEIECIVSGCNRVTDLDLQHYRLYNTPPGNMRIRGGFGVVPRVLARSLPEGTVRFGHVVERVEWLSPGDPAAAERGGERHAFPVTLHCSNGTVIRARHVVLTVSLGVLRAAVGAGANDLETDADTASKGEGALAFHPPLPFEKQACIRRLGFGVVNKVLLVHGEKWTPPNLGMLMLRKYPSALQQVEGGSWLDRVSVVWFEEGRVELLVPGTYSRRHCHRAAAATAVVATTAIVAAIAVAVATAATATVPTRCQRCTISHVVARRAQVTAHWRWSRCPRRRSRAPACRSSTTFCRATTRACRPSSASCAPPGAATPSRAAPTPTFGLAPPRVTLKAWPSRCRPRRTR